MKIVWICSLFRFEDEIFKKIKFISDKEPVLTGLWIPLLSEELAKKNVEVHIICTHKAIAEDIKISKNNIHYYFISQKIPFIKRSYPHFIKYNSKYVIFRKKTKRIIKRIKPDIVNLHGTEHDLSISIIDVKYPKIVTIQGLIHSVYENNPINYYKHILNNEKIIFRKCNNFGIRAKFLELIIRKYNESAKFYWFYYPFSKTIITKEDTIIEKDNDIIFAARICKDKGVEDLIEACKFIVKKIPNFSLKIFGPINLEYRRIIEKKIETLKIGKNIELVGFLKNHADLRKEYLKSKICVLPTYHDIIPGTIIESLKLGIPVVSYKINGVIDFNANQEIIKLVDKGDIKALADAIISLLSDEDNRKIIGLNSQKEAIERFDNSKNMELLLDSYEKIIKEFSKGER